MKKIVLIAGIIVVVACVFSLIYALFNMYGYRHVLDGSPALYDRLHRRTIIFTAIGAVLALIATLVIVLRRRLF